MASQGMRTDTNALGTAPGHDPAPAPGQATHIAALSIGDIPCPTSGIDPGRRTVLVVVHNASRTGAPILGWNIARGLRQRHNIVVVLLGDGPLLPAYAEVAEGVVALPRGTLDDSDTRILASRLAEVYAPSYAIANSVATRDLAVALERRGVPVVALVHEFASDFAPRALDKLLVTASRVVFPAEIVVEAAWRDNARPRTFIVHPQGPTEVPKLGPESLGPAHGAAAGAFLETLPADAFLVLGIGSVYYRKGVDAFLSTARDCRAAGRTDIRFAWVGHVPPNHVRYREYLAQQIKRSGIEDCATLIDEVEDLRPLYGRANAFLLSSRLDPMPNVAIDAAVAGLPIVCFANAGGISDLLGRTPETAGLVVPYMDSAAAARAIMGLADDKSHADAVSRATREMAAGTFDMAAYIDLLDNAGLASAAERVQRDLDARTLLDGGGINQDLYFGLWGEGATPETAVTRYLDAARLVKLDNPHNGGLFVRRPVEGFNPLIYAASAAGPAGSAENPLAHFIRAGRPPGPWLHQVILPGARPEAATGLKVALHAHMYYPDLLDEFLTRLEANESRVDLLVTTGADQRSEIEATLARRGHEAEIIVVPNRGRDIGPLLVAIRSRVLGRYDIVGHLHGKRSAHLSPEDAERWRDFALQHTLGADHPMMDTVLAAMAADPGLGLVFPEDPHLNAWDANLEIGGPLARRMGAPEPLLTQFDFPIGTMFWARTAALAPLFDLNLGWDDFPPEPLALDGTILHALERLVGFSAQAAGYRYATTYVRACRR